MARQYQGSDDADKVCPSANGGGFVLPHEPHRFHEIDQQHHGLLSNECDACTPNIKLLGPRCLFFAFVHRAIVYAEPASQIPAPAS